MTEHFRFSPDILSRLGEELNPNADQGIMELVRNSYDADAVKCRVELIGTDESGGTVRVTDDGLGMSRQALRDGWLVLGKSSKQIRVTERKRRVIGNKGLGRLAALRLGKTTTVTTWPKGERFQYSLAIDWADFAAVQVVEDVSLRIAQALRDNITPEHGTVVEIQELHTRLTRAEVKRLARSLVLMADPFDKSLGFQPTLVAPGQKDLESLVASSYFEEAQFHLVAELSEDGTASAKVLDWKGQTLFEADSDDLRRKRKSRGPSERPYACPPAKFDLWVYPLDVKTEAFSARAVTVTEVRQWLSEYGGVHIYHNGVRVHPYGDSGHDWLNLNLARVRNPELRPSTNNSIGRVSVMDISEQLKQKTDRTGFIDNEQFEEMRRFAEDALEWMARRRLLEREARRHREAEQASAGVKSASSSVEAALKTISPGPRKKVQTAFEKYQRARDKETKTLRDDLQLYRTLATVGTTSAVLAHEVKKPVQQIGTMAKMLERIGRVKLGTEYAGSLEGPVSHIRRAADAIQTFANVTSTLLQKEKRRGGRIAVHPVIEGIGKLFCPFLQIGRAHV